MSQTNYVPQIFVQTFTADYGPQGAGTGSPEGVATGYPGYTYVDVTGPTLYIFSGTPGETTGWSSVSGGGGGGGTLTTLSGTGSPNGAATGNPGYTYTQVDNSSLWAKITGTGTNTGWTQIVG